MNKWISVKEKLPDNRVGKIVYCEDQSVTLMYYDPEKKYWISQMGFDRYDVTHWMDRPEPPSGLTPGAVDVACEHANPVNPRGRLFCPDCGNLIPATPLT